MIKVVLRESASPPLVLSKGTTVSASVGRGAPVMMRTHSPRRIAGSSVEPAATSPTTLSSTGSVAVAPRTSANRTAKPSIAELSKTGMSTAACTSSRNVSPSASLAGYHSAGSGRTRLRITARCSATVRIALTPLPTP